MVCSDDGVVVRVRPREARGEVPAYEYVVGSERDAAAAVRIRQPIPADVDEADLGFPSSCERHWTVDGADLVAELVVQPGQHVKTVWGVRSDSHPEIEPPTVETAPVEDGADGSGSAGGSDGGLDLEEPAPTDLDGIGSGAGATRSADGLASPGSDSLVAQLVHELESGSVDAEKRAALADALEIQTSDSTNAFVDHVQSKVERRADRLESEIESIEESVEQLYGVKADSSELSSIKRGLTDLDDKKVARSDLRTVRDRVDEMEAGVESEVSSVRSEVADLAERTEDAATAEELAGLEQRLDELETTVSELGGKLADLETRHEQLGESHDQLAADAATDEDIETVRSDLRNQVNASMSEISNLKTTLEEEYTSDAEISATVDRRLNRGVGTLVLFGIGAAALLATVPLALDGSILAAATLLAGAGSLGAWWHVLGTGDE